MRQLLENCPQTLLRTGEDCRYKIFIVKGFLRTYRTGADGSNRWPAVHRLDAAYLFRLALEKGPIGSRYNGIGDEGIPVREIAEVIGKHLNLPVVSISSEEAVNHFDWMSRFITFDSPASSNKTREQLGWQPTHPDLLDDLDAGH